MKTQGTLARLVCGAIALAAVGPVSEGRLEATPPQGVTFTVLNRATVGEFDAKRIYGANVGTNADSPGNWKIDLRATRMIDVVTVLFTVQPGGDGGWHTHPGPSFFTVSEGTLTVYDGHDPSCTPQVFPAGTGALEADTSGHIHTLRNETGSVARTVVTFLVPVGAPIRTDLPNPGNCPF